MAFGAVLKNLRTKKGISIKKMARDIGLNYTYISKLEHSKVNPSSDVVKKISDYLDYSSDELLLLAGKIPDDIKEILINNPREAARYLRRKFVAD